MDQGYGEPNQETNIRDTAYGEENDEYEQNDDEEQEEPKEAEKPIVEESNENSLYNQIVEPKITKTPPSQVLAELLHIKQMEVN